MSLKRIGVETEPPLSSIVWDGQDTGAAIPGAVLEAALDCGSRFLVLTSDGVIFEEGLNILLLDGDSVCLTKRR